MWTRSERRARRPRSILDRQMHAAASSNMSSASVVFLLSCEGDSAGTRHRMNCSSPRDRYGNDLTQLELHSCSSSGSDHDTVITLTCRRLCWLQHQAFLGGDEQVQRNNSSCAIDYCRGVFDVGRFLRRNKGSSVLNVVHVFSLGFPLPVLLATFYSIVL